MLAQSKDGEMPAKPAVCAGCSFPMGDVLRENPLPLHLDLTIVVRFRILPKNKRRNST